MLTSCDTSMGNRFGAPFSSPLVTRPRDPDAPAWDRVAFEAQLRDKGAATTSTTRSTSC
jgi:hypothetical protein